MKTIKLIVFFIVIVGVIFLALNGSSLFDGLLPDDDFPEEDLIDISEKCDEIRQSWSTQTQWSDDLYRTQREDINQSKAMGMFSREGYNTVNNCLRETSTNKACECYMSALHSKNFSGDALKKAFNGVKAIKAYEKLDKDDRIKRIEGINSLYLGISSFVQSNHTITPHFDTDAADWKSFASLQSAIFSKAKGYRNNPLFKELQHIPGFQSGLSEDFLIKKTGPQRSTFYNELSSQIVAYFNTVEPTQDKINLLNQIYKNFTYQESDYGVAELATLKVNFGKSE